MNSYAEILHKDFPNVSLELLHEAFEERAGILQFEAGYPKEIAEKTAYYLVFDEFTNKQ